MNGKEFKLPLDLPAIQKCIPHRYPFLLVDKVIHLEVSQSIIAIKHVSASEPILQGHFPGMPLFPGVLVLEGLAQASGILGYYSIPYDYEQMLLTEISEARFKRKVDCGDTLRFEVKVEKFRAPFFWFNGCAYVENEIAAKARFSARLK